MPSPIVSRARSSWSGDLESGNGNTTLVSSGLASFDVTWKARAEEHGGLTSPEELIAAAIASCFPMQLSLLLSGEGATVERLDTSADVTFVAGTGITGIHLTLKGSASGVSHEDFYRIAEEAKKTCPVSKALTGTEITLDATVV
jgi:osmotically inducible protein OsmC